MKETATNGQEVSIRPAAMSDLGSVIRVAELYDISMIGDPEVDESDFTDAWQNPRTSMEKDTFVAVSKDLKTGDELLLGYEHCTDPAANGRLEIEGFVRPGFGGRGIGSALLQKALARAQERAAGFPRDTPVFIRLGTFKSDTDADDLMRSFDLERVRFFLRMNVKLTSSPDSFEPPEGILIEPLSPDASLRPIHAACDAIFADHWGNTPVSYDEWVSLRTGGDRFDRSLWFVATDTMGAVAGVSLCTNHANMGWVSTLGVVRAFRGRGIAKALLARSFAEFHSRGQLDVGLTVDAENLTGAARLYESVGMHSLFAISVWEKNLP